MRTTWLRYFDEQRDEMEARIARDTARYRQGRFELALEGREGEALRVPLQLVQTGHDFNFGSTIFMLDEFEDEERNAWFREIFPQLNNYMVAPLYWSDLEPEAGKPRYAPDAKPVYRRPPLDLIVDYAEQQQLRVKGHPLMWRHFLPDWLPLDGEAVFELLRARVHDLAQRYSHVFVDVDVVNEAMSADFGLRDPRLVHDYLNRSYALADEAFPNSRLFINEVPYLCFEHARQELSHYYLAIENLLLKGRRIDGIGLQAHMYFDVEETEYPLSRFYLNPEIIWDVLDSYGRFGKPIQISEVSCPPSSTSARTRGAGRAGRDPLPPLVQPSVRRRHRLVEHRRPHGGLCPDWRKRRREPLGRRTLPLRHASQAGRRTPRPPDQPRLAQQRDPRTRPRPRRRGAVRRPGLLRPLRGLRGGRGAPLPLAAGPASGGRTQPQPAPRRCRSPLMQHQYGKMGQSDDSARHPSLRMGLGTCGASAH